MANRKTNGLTTAIIVLIVLVLVGRLPFELGVLLLQHSFRTGSYVATAQEIL